MMPAAIVLCAHLTDSVNCCCFLIDSAISHVNYSCLLCTVPGAISHVNYSCLLCTIPCWQGMRSIGFYGSGFAEYPGYSMVSSESDLSISFSTTEPSALLLLAKNVNGDVSTPRYSFPALRA